MNYTLSGNVSEAFGQGAQGAATAPFDTASGSTSISLNQPLLKNFWIDSTRLNIKVAKNRLKYYELGLKLTIMTIATTVEQAYYDLIYARENVTVQEKAVELATQLVVENKKRVEFGALAILDQEQAEAQEASSRATLIAAKGALVTQQNTVKQLITDNYAAMQPVELQPTAPLSAPVRVLTGRSVGAKGWRNGPTCSRPSWMWNARASRSGTTTTSSSRSWTSWAATVMVPAA